MELSEYIDEPTITALRRLLPDDALKPTFKLVQGASEPSVSIELTLPAGAEYRFVLFFRPEMQIHAMLVDSDAAQYFWYEPFEAAAFRNSMEKLNDAFIKTVELIVRHETRIIQKRTLLNHVFRCEYNSARGWEKVYSHAALRLGGFRVPPITRRQHVYASPAIAPSSKES